MIKTLLLSFFIFATSVVFAKDYKVQGLVFHDTNNNSIYDKEDIPLENILVSSLSNIVTTNANGKFEISVKEKDIVFIIKPSEYEFKLREDNLPDFFKLCYHEASPEFLKYEGTTELTPKNETYNFPLYKSEIKSEHKAQIIGDIQAPTKKDIEYFQQLIVPDLYKHSADFKICLGDNADNNLNIYPEITKSLSGIKTPLYMVFGNHDVNYRSLGIANQAETFRKFFGPDYYSFNYGNTHYIVLNTVLYNGWNKQENKKGGYNGGIDEQQQQWLRQDLSYVDKDKQVVIFGHIPLFPGFAKEEKIRNVFSELKGYNKILAIYGHVHGTGNWKHSPDFYWDEEGDFYGHIAGSACGSWWSGPFGNDSIPEAISTDGTPPGFFLYQFHNDGFDKQFIPAGKSTDYQLRISAPQSKIEKDSIDNEFIYVNVFDGGDQTEVKISIDGGEELNLDKVLEPDPFVRRNQSRRINRGGWNPGLGISTHLWKTNVPTHLKKGMHTIKATCRLDNNKVYTTYKVFEIK